MADADDDASRRAEELDALRSFYCSDLLEGEREEDEGRGSSSSTSCSSSVDGPWRIRVGRAVVLELRLPPDYPSRGVPTPVVRGPQWALEPGKAEALESELVEMHVPDSEVAIMWAEHCRAELDFDGSGAGGGDGGEYGIGPDEESGKGEAAEQIAGDENGESAAANDGAENGGGGVRTFVPPTSKYGQPTRSFDPAVILSDANRRTIHRGRPYHPPKSGPSETMIAHVASVKSMDHVNWVIAELLFNDRKVARATHNMIAYRFWDEGRGCMVSDNDDDGEKGSGTKLAALLEMSDAKDVMVVVSRWYGGVLLGPARFKYIASAARDALVEAGFIGGNSSEDGRGGGGGGSGGATTTSKRKGRKG